MIQTSSFQAMSLTVDIPTACVVPVEQEPHGGRICHDLPTHHVMGKGRHYDERCFSRAVETTTADLTCQTPAYLDVALVQ